MKHVIVIAGHRVQFEEFVKATIAKKAHIHGYPGYVVIEGVTFKYVSNDLPLRGMELGEDSELVKVGTWYELPSEDIEGIERQFELRKKCGSTKCECRSCRKKLHAPETYGE